MSALNNNNLRDNERRIVWVDYALGICIIVIVMMHSTLDYEYAVGREGWLHQSVVFVRPFAVPAFFMLSAIFLSSSIHAPFRDYFDKKFVQFFYVYLVWLTIQLVITESSLLVQEPAQFFSLFFVAWIEPVDTLWLVYMLAIFYMATRLLADAPKALVFLLAAFCQIASGFGWINTGWSLPDNFFDYYIYFVFGYVAAPWLFSFTRQIPEWKLSSISMLTVWAMINGLLTTIGSDTTPGISLLLGFSGIAAIVAASSLLATRSWTGWLRYCGANFIVIYLSVFLSVRIALSILADGSWITDVGTASLLVTAFAISVSLIFHWLITDTGAKFLYQRPEFFRLTANESRRLKY